MKMLLNNALVPITKTVGFLEADATRAADFFTHWRDRILKERGAWFTVQPVAGSLDAALRRLLPFTTVEFRRALFVPTRGPWTAYFDNGHRGTDMAAIRYMARELQCRGMRVTCVEHTLKASKAPPHPKKGQYGATIFEIYSHEEKASRSIACMNDGGRWIFETFGTELPFEEKAKYTERKIKDRFTPEMLERYAQALGVDPFNADFYCADAALLVEQHGPRLPNSRDRTLEEVQSEW